MHGNMSDKPYTIQPICIFETLRGEYDSLQISIEPAFSHHFTSLESSFGKWSIFYLLNSFNSSAALGKMTNKQKAFSIGIHSPGSVRSKSLKKGRRKILWLTSLN